jgi:hypothetical protein
MAKNSRLIYLFALLLAVIVFGGSSRASVNAAEPGDYIYPDWCIGDTIANMGVDPSVFSDDLRQQIYAQDKIMCDQLRYQNPVSGGQGGGTTIDPQEPRLPKEPQEPKKEPENPPMDACNQKKLPLITDYSPKQVSAGVFDGLNKNYWAEYSDNKVKVILKGECLDGLIINSKNYGLDGNLSAYVDGNGLDSGTTGEKSFVLGITPYAKYGKDSIILDITNKYGVSQKITFDVVLSGDQYLNMYFAVNNPIFKTAFYGHYESMDSSEVQATVNSLNSVYGLMYKTSYRKLGLFIKVYKLDVWEKLLADVGRDKRTLGYADCVYKGCSTTVSLGNYSQLSVPESLHKLLEFVIIHEATHVLHSCVNGTINTNSLCVEQGFEKKWNDLVVQSLTLDVCTEYLPIRSFFEWKDGSSEPRCGYTDPYAASSYTNLANKIRDFIVRIFSRHLEDVAQFNQMRYFRPDLITQKGDAVSKQFKNVYLQKALFLNEFGF